MKKNYFTLCELMIVTGVIAIFAILAVPAFSSAAGNAQQIACADNLGKIAAAVSTYCNDNDDYMPSVAYSDTYPSNWSSHLDVIPVPSKSSAWQLRPYLADWQLTHCPAGYANMPERQKQESNGTSFPYTSYLAFWNACPPQAKYNWFNGKEPTRAFDPGNWLLVGDISSVNTESRYQDLKSNHGEAKKPDGGNWAMVDGSVRWHKAAELTRSNGCYVYPEIQPEQ